VSSEAQLAAHRAHALLSTGPRTEAGKEALCFNNFRHGLAGAFHILDSEAEEDFDSLKLALEAEHRPQTPTEQVLVARMAQHEWLRQRASHLQNLCFSAEGIVTDEKQFALYLRYQTTHERAFSKCLSDLLKLRAEKRKAEIGFESQKQKEADQTRKQEAHEARTRLTNAKAEHLELNTAIKGHVQAVLPGHTPIPFDELKGVLQIALEEVFGSRIRKHAA
jgi:hypothetical protein